LKQNGSLFRILNDLESGWHASIESPNQYVVKKNVSFGERKLDERCES